MKEIKADGFMVILAERRDKIIYRDGDRLIKLFDANYSKSNILNEALNQARVAETGLNIPRVREVTVIDGRPAIVMDFIEGETLEARLREGGPRREETLELFVRLQRRVHACKHLLLTKYSDKLRMKILRSDLPATVRYDLSMRLDGMPRHTHVLHGDFIPSNVIVRDDGTPFIVDWSHASQGNATADAAKTYLLLGYAGETSLAEAYRELFCKISGASEAYFREWLPIVAAAQLLRENRAFFLKYAEEAEG